MATIQQFQDVLKDKTNQLIVEYSIGKDLIERIKEGGGEWKVRDDKDIYEFINIPFELEKELKNKMRLGEERIRKIGQQWTFIIR